MRRTIIVGTDQLLKAAERLMESGEITPLQYYEMCMRNKEVSKDYRKNIVLLQCETNLFSQKATPSGFSKS